MLAKSKELLCSFDFGGELLYRHVSALDGSNNLLEFCEGGFVGEGLRHIDDGR